MFSVLWLDIEGLKHLDMLDTHNDIIQLYLQNYFHELELKRGSCSLKVVLQCVREDEIISSFSCLSLKALTLKNWQKKTHWHVQ